jgi:hypothetical protein
MATVTRIPIPAAIDRSEIGQPVVSIAIELIDVPKQWREIAPAEIEEMARSIAEVGMLQPIGVSANGPRFLLLFGQTRMLAHLHLGKRLIDARIFEVENDEHRQVITDVENLRRTRLQAAEEVRAMGRWQAWYNKRHPEAVIPPTVHEHRTQRDQLPPGAAKAPGFVSQASQGLGQSRRNVKYTLAITRAISDDDLAALAQVDVNRETLKKIAALKNDDHRRRVINLVLMDIPVDEAILDITSPPGQRVEHKQTRSIPPDIPPLQERKEEDLTDDEWVQTYCKDLFKRIPEPARKRFKTEAILYRHTRPARQEFAARTRQALAQSRQIDPGPFHFAMSRVVNFDHPSSWLVCGQCHGIGSIHIIGDCPGCHGHGFIPTSTTTRRDKRV